MKAIEKAVKRLEKGEPDHPPLLASEACQFLLEKTKKYANSPAGQNPDRKFIPYPASWFNGKCYLDDETEWEEHSGQEQSKKKPAAAREDTPARWQIEQHQSLN